MLGEGLGAYWERTEACWDRASVRMGRGVGNMLGGGPGQVALTQRSSTEGFLRAGLEAPMATCPRGVMGRCFKARSRDCLFGLGDRAPWASVFSPSKWRLEEEHCVPSGSLGFWQAVIDPCPEQLGSEARAKDSQCFGLAGCGYGGHLSWCSGGCGQLLRGRGQKQEWANMRSRLRFRVTSLGVRATGTVLIWLVCGGV